MKRHRLTLAVAAVLAAVIALAFLAPEPMLSPGRLSPAHAGLASDCFACHRPLRGADPRRCMDCHALADIGLRTTKGAPLAHPTTKVSFHRFLVEHDCMACHAEHQGGGRAQAAPKPFAHSMLRADVRARCASCHVPPKDDLHADPTAPCGQCHHTTAWRPATFDHSRHFVLDRHHDVRCAVCHVDRDFRRYTCYGCHEHTPERTRREHLEEGLRNIDDCARCHRDARGDDGDRDAGEREERD